MGMECMETIAHAWVWSIARDVERARGEREGWFGGDTIGG